MLLFLLSACSNGCSGNNNNKNDDYDDYPTGHGGASLSVDSQSGSIAAQVTPASPTNTGLSESLAEAAQGLKNLILG